MTSVRQYLLLCLAIAGTSAATASDDTLDMLMRLQTGSFTSAAQARQDERYDEVIWHIVEIWPGQATGERWIYTEGWLPDAESPYMQRIARYSQREDGSIVAARYQLPDPSRFIGGWKETERFAGLDRASLVGLPGCETVMARTGPQRFEGGTVGTGCLNTHRGASYAVSQTVLDERGLVNWDRGFAEDGSQRWGPVAGGYRFRRLDDPGSCVDPVRLLVYGNVQQREQFVAYARALAESGLYPAYGGHYEATTPALAVLEGNPPSGRGVIIARFPCLEAVQGFWNSPEYGEIRKLREGIAEFEVLVLPALGPVPD
ncbi:MAG: DUF1330 domain-containing protein [Chromatiales bacterium]|nr:DUF1330 domain-containing protein [Chromatiales bacterium]